MKEQCVDRVGAILAFVCHSGDAAACNFICNFVYVIVHICDVGYFHDGLGAASFRTGRS